MKFPGETAPVQSNERGEIPWVMHVHAWQVYAALGHGGQSAKRIAERGGFGYLELALMLDYRNPWGQGQPMSDEDKEQALRFRAEGRESLS
jgi:hypothetical protein